MLESVVPPEAMVYDQLTMFPGRYPTESPYNISQLSYSTQQGAQYQDAYGSVHPGAHHGIPNANHMQQGWMYHQPRTSPYEEWNTSGYANATPSQATMPSHAYHKPNEYVSQSNIMGLDGPSLSPSSSGSLSTSPSQTSPSSNGMGSMVNRAQPRQPYDWMKKQSYQSMPHTGKTRTKDKYRVVYSDHQRLELEKEFHYSRYITIRRKAELSSCLGLSERQVKIWFQNRRAKERKHNKKKEEMHKTAAHSTVSPINTVPPNVKTENMAVITSQ